MLEDGETYGVVLIVEAYLGRIKVANGSGGEVFPHISKMANSSGSGGETSSGLGLSHLEFDTIMGKGALHSLKKSPITFRDGTQSEIAIGPFTRPSSEYMPSAAASAGRHSRCLGNSYNEFALIEPSRLRIRFVLLYKKERVLPVPRQVTALSLPLTNPIRPIHSMPTDVESTRRGEDMLVDMHEEEEQVEVVDDDDEDDDEVVIAENYEKRNQLTDLQLSEARTRLMKELIQKRDRYIVLEGPDSATAERVNQKLQLFREPNIHDHLKVLMEL